jgi:nicotinamidase-related amidase
MQPLPIPSFFEPQKVDQIWRVPYKERAKEAKDWARQWQISPATTDKKRVCLLLIDIQNTFCLPDFELFVGGKSGRGAIEDNIRLCKFIYRNLDRITTIVPTLDTHTARQIFHPIFWIDERGEHPENATIITLEDVEKRKWRINPDMGDISIYKDRESLEKYAYNYVKRLSYLGKYPLTIWSYHAMLGGIGHALVAAVEEAIFFHSITRVSQTNFELKGGNPLTENYSVLRPEIIRDAEGKTIANKNAKLIQMLLDFDAVIIAGQAKSHCVAWTIADLLTEIELIDKNLAQKIYLLEDCTSPVVVPNVIDFSDRADATFQSFANAGMNLIQSTNLKHCALANGQQFIV